MECFQCNWRIYNPFFSSCLRKQFNGFPLEYAANRWILARIWAIIYIGIIVDYFIICHGKVLLYFFIVYEQVQNYVQVP